MTSHLHFLSQMWFWSIILILATIWALIRFVLVPIIKRKKILNEYKIFPPFLLPLLPEELDKRVFVPSLLNKNKFYRVNLYKMTCSCTSFRRHRVHYPRNDIHRFCRHLRMELENSNAIVYYDEVIRRIIKDRVRDKYYKRVNILGMDIMIGFNPKYNYVRIFTRTFSKGDLLESGPFTGFYDKFTYNLNQDIWVYREAPPGAHEILAFVNNFMTEYKKDFNETTDTTNKNLATPPDLPVK
ncbi:MAG: hypothetical protein H7832_10155 [Magnetococcus sp. DMHC-6]